MLIMLHLVATGAANFARQQLIAMTGSVERASRIAAEVAGDEWHSRWIYELSIAFSQLLFDAVKAQTDQGTSQPSSKSSDASAEDAP